MFFNLFNNFGGRFKFKSVWELAESANKKIWLEQRLLKKGMKEEDYPSISEC